MLDRIANYNYLAAFTIQVFELLADFDQDVKWVWLQVKPSSWAKWDFIFMRYGALAFQAVILWQSLRSTNYPHLPSQCFPWLLLRTISPYVFLAATQAILISRVHALYNRNKRILIILVFLYVMSNICSGVTFGIVLSKPVQYNDRCEPVKVTGDWVYSVTGLIPFALDLTMLFLTTLRVIRLSRGPRSEPLLRIILRDGTWAVFVVWLCVLSAIIISRTRFLVASYVIANSWLPTGLSFTTTRLILNLRRYRSESSHSQLSSGDHSSRADNASITTAVDFELSLFARSAGRTTQHVI